MRRQWVSVIPTGQWLFLCLSTGLVETILDIHMRRWGLAQRHESSTPHPLLHLWAELPTQLEKLRQDVYRPSVDGFLCLQHSSKDQLWLIQRDPALLLETHVHIARSAMVLLGHLQQSDVCWNRGYANSNHVGAIVSQPWLNEVIDLSKSLILRVPEVQSQYPCKWWGRHLEHVSCQPPV